MAIDNIYYLDQFTQNILKTNSDQTTTDIIENVASLAGTEGLINLQTDNNSNFYLFGDTAEVYTRTLTGTWTKILDLATQSSLLNITSGDTGNYLGNLNASDSKIRCPFVTPDGNIYIAYEVLNNLFSGGSSNYAGAGNIYSVKVLHYTGGTSWEVLISLPQELFVGFADLFDSTIALKTTNVSQFYGHCNKITTIHGSSTTTVAAPGTGVKPLVTSLYDSNINEGTDVNLLYKTALPSGEILILTDTHLTRVSPTFVKTSYPMTVASGLAVNQYGRGTAVVVGNYLVWYSTWQYTPSATQHKYATIDLTTNTIVHTGIWSAGTSIVASINMNNGKALIIDNSKLCYLFNPIADTFTSTGTYTTIGDPGIYSSYVTATEVIITTFWRNSGTSTGAAMGVQHYNISNGTWTLYPTDQYVFDFWPLEDGTLCSNISGGYNFGIYDPTTHTITKKITLTPNGNDYSAPTLGGTYPNSYDGGAVVSAGTKLHVLSSQYNCVYTFDSAGSGSYSRLVFVDMQNMLTPRLNSIINVSLLDANTLTMRFFDPVSAGNVGRINVSTVSFTLTSTIDSVSNIQAISGISLNELYCVGLKGYSNNMYTTTGQTSGAFGQSGFGAAGTYNDPDGIEHISYIYKWNGSAWSMLYTIPTVSSQRYKPYLMSARYVSSNIELVMLGSTPDTVCIYSNGTIATAVMQEVPGNQNIYNGSEAPSIPVVANTDLCAVVALLLFNIGDGGGPYPDDFTNYAQARLVYRTDLGLYCLVRNNEFYYVTIFPASRNAISVEPNKSYYLSIPIITDSPVALQGTVLSVDSHLTATVHSMSNKQMDIKIDVGSGVTNSTGVMTFTPTVAIAGAFTGTSAATQVVSMLVPPTPAAKHFPVQVDLGSQYNGLYKSGTTLYASDSNGIAVSTDTGATWTFTDTYTSPAVNTSGSTWTTDTILSVCENSPIGAVATSKAGIQKPNSYWTPIQFAQDASVPSGTLPTDFAYASATVVTLPYSASGSVTTSDVAMGDGSYYDMFRFDITEYSNVQITALNGTSWQTYLEIDKLVGTPSNYVSTYVTDNWTDGNSSGVDPHIGIYLYPGSYYLIVNSDITNGVPAVATGNYTLSITAEVAIPPALDVPKNLVYNGTSYLALTGSVDEDYFTNISYSTDLVNFTKFINPDTSLPYVNPDAVYWGFNAIKSATNGTSIVCLGSLVLRVDSANNITVPTGIAGQQSNGENTIFATDNAGKWVMTLNGGSTYCSSDDGLTWTDITSTINSIYTSHSAGLTTRLYMEYVNSKFVLIGVPSYSNPHLINVVQSTSVNFSTGITYYNNVNTLSTGFAPIGSRAVGNTLVMMINDHVVTSTNSGQTWS